MREIYLRFVNIAHIFRVFMTIKILQSKINYLSLLCFDGLLDMY